MKQGRREFLRAAAIAAAIPTGIVTATDETVPIRVFGKTGLRLPILAYGGAALPKAWHNPLSRENRVELVRYAFDRGIRYFDTAGNYMESQSILGEALKDRRNSVCLVSKVETTNPAQVRGQVEKAMRELQTDHLDAILIHGTPGIQQMSVKRAMQIHAELVKLRDERITSFIGLSAHGYFDKALALIESGGFDLCMLSYGYIPRGHDQLFSERMIELREACLAKAHDLKMGIAAMKVIGAGMLGGWAPHIVPGYDKTRIRQMPGAAIRWVLKDDRIDLLVIGMRLRKEIDENIDILARDTTYTADDRALLKDYCAKAYKTDAIKKLKVE
jgi:predicted aldo/keto reductase-like oxidoreductase